MMKTEMKDLLLLKDELQSVMKHLLDLLREILASIHEERIVLGRDEIHQIQDVLSRRQNLLEAFDHCYKDFVHFLHTMTEDLAANFSLSEGLEWLQIHLDAEDVELLLLSEQLVRLGQEMQTETKTLIGFLEHKSAFGSPLTAYFTKIAPKPARVAVGLVDEDEESENNSDQ